MSHNTASSPSTVDALFPAETAFGTVDYLQGLGVEVLGFRVVADDRVGRLLGVQLVLLGQLHADPARLEEGDDLRPVFEVGAGAVAQGEPRSRVAELEEVLDVVGVL